MNIESQTLTCYLILVITTHLIQNNNLLIQDQETWEQNNLDQIVNGTFGIEDDAQVIQVEQPNLEHQFHEDINNQMGQYRFLQWKAINLGSFGDRPLFDYDNLTDEEQF